MRFKQDTRVRVHCLITDEYGGSAHHICNTNSQLTKKILVILHNIRGYDGHCIMQDFGKFN